MTTRANQFDASEFEERGDIFDRASYWHGLIEEGQPTGPERERFAQWLAADSRNSAAYASIRRAWMGMGNAAVDERILSMRRDALAIPTNSRQRKYGSTAIAASILMALVFGAGLLVHRGRLGANAGEFVTQVGQRSSITLADGSTVMLDTASRIRVEFDARVRRVRLLTGQAWFEVAKNQPRPFMVEAGDQVVTAHGTAFDVRLEEHDQIRVTLIEGRVSVEEVARPGEGIIRPDASRNREELLPGEQLVVTATRLPIKQKADIAKATSWRAGQIIFDNDTLENAVAEINRYSTRQIVLADPHLASLRVSGVFIAGHSESFVETVTGNFPIKANPAAGDRLLLTAN